MVELCRARYNFDDKFSCHILRNGIFFIHQIFVSNTIGRCGPLQTFTIHHSNKTPSVHGFSIDIEIFLNMDLSSLWNVSRVKVYDGNSPAGCRI